MRKISLVIAVAASTFGCGTASVDQLNTEIAQLQGDIAALQDQLALLDVRVEAAETANEGRVGDVASLQESVTTLTTDLTSLSEEIDAVNGAVDLTDLADEVAANTVLVDDHETRVAALEAAGYATESWVLGRDYVDSNSLNGGLAVTSSTLQSEIDANTLAVGANSAAIASNTTAVVANGATAAATAATVVSHGDRLTETEATVGINSGLIADNSASIAVNGQALSGASTQILLNATGLVSTNDALAGQTALLVGMQDEIATNRAGVLSNVTAILANSEGIGTNAGSIDINGDGIEALVLTTAGLQADVAEVEDDIASTVIAAGGAVADVAELTLTVDEHTLSLSVLETELASELVLSNAAIAANASGLASLVDDVALNSEDIAANAVAHATNALSIAANTVGVAESLTGHTPALWEMSSAGALDGHDFGRSGALMLTSDGAFLQNGPVVTTDVAQTHRVTFFVVVPSGGVSVALTLCGGGAVSVEVDGFLATTSLDLAGGCQAQSPLALAEGSHAVAFSISDVKNNQGIGVLNGWVAESGLSVDYIGMRAAAVGGI